MTFAPEKRTGEYRTLGFNELWDRAGGDKARIREALASDDLKAYVRPEGEGPDIFYRVPAGHWKERAGRFVEGEPGERLFLWADSDVPPKFDNLPLLFFNSDVMAWESPREDVPEIQSGPAPAAIVQPTTPTAAPPPASTPRRGKLAGKPGPKSRPKQFRDWLAPHFNRFHPLLAEMGRRGRHDHVVKHWSGEGNPPSANTVESVWDEHLERRAQSARSETAQ